MVDFHRSGRRGLSQKESLFIAQGLECGALSIEYPYIVDPSFIDASRATARWSVIGQEEDQWRRTQSKSHRSWSFTRATKASAAGS